MNSLSTATSFTRLRRNVAWKLIRVSNAFYITLICQLLHILLIFNNLLRTSDIGDYDALLYDVPKITCNIAFTCYYLCLLHVT